MMTMSTLGPSISVQYFTEPKLRFAESREHIDPKQGIIRFGPKSLDLPSRHPAIVRVGLVGSAESSELARKWLEINAAGITGDPGNLEFPGYQADRGFFSSLVFGPDWVAQLNRSEIDGVMQARPARVRFESLVALFDHKLRLLTMKDQRPDLALIAVPDELFKKCRVVNYRDPELGTVHRDLRRAIKAAAMKYRLPTQLILQSTTEGKSGNHPSAIAWNLFTSLYFKVGGFPWEPTGLQPGTCYIGIGFFRPLGSTPATMRTSLVQAFDEHGNGLILRGPDFQWDILKEGTPAPHLTEHDANEIVKLVLDRYREEVGQTPQRVVVHKTSRYWPDEKAGFETALREKAVQYDLLALTPQGTTRLFPANLYPPLRGTRFSVEEVDYLYTTGYISELNQFHSVHVPSPLQIADHIGYDTPRDQLLKEILVLTKMNTNSARLGGLLPITLKFTRLVGEILREIPPDREPLTNFKYYM
jgi:hypothetical protein